MKDAQRVIAIKPHHFVDIITQLSDDEVAGLRRAANGYVEKIALYRNLTLNAAPYRRVGFTDFEKANSTPNFAKTKAARPCESFVNGD